MKKQPDAPGRTVGIRKMARSYRYAEQIGEFVCISPYEAVGAKIQWTKKISQRKVPTDSDEAIVSHDLG